ncbi:MAG TPA: hypothetical protein VJZ91_00845, partial [Blastocatellia bacterium]|nr:hypothetical protein [Blastocatellia bacterium]
AAAFLRGAARSLGNLAAVSGRAEFAGVFIVKLAGPSLAVTFAFVKGLARLGILLLFLNRDSPCLRRAVAAVALTGAAAA